MMMMMIDALNVLGAQLMCDLFAIAKFLLILSSTCTVNKDDCKNMPLDV